MKAHRKTTELQSHELTAQCRLDGRAQNLVQCHLLSWLDHASSVWTVHRFFSWPQIRDFSSYGCKVILQFNYCQVSVNSPDHCISVPISPSHKDSQKLKTVWTAPIGRAEISRSFFELVTSAPLLHRHEQDQNSHHAIFGAGLAWLGVCKYAESLSEPSTALSSRPSLRPTQATWARLPFVRAEACNSCWVSCSCSDFFEVKIWLHVVRCHCWEIACIWWKKKKWIPLHQGARRGVVGVPFSLQSWIRFLQDVEQEILERL